MDSEEISSISDPEGDAPFASPSAQESQRRKSGKANLKPGGVAEDFKLTNTLKVPRATTYAASALNEQIIRGDIELNPEYQRDVVWSTQKQIGLIDSIFRNFYVPPVIFSVTCNDDGSETKTCIDGKQRLTSIHLFMTGAIPHRDTETGQQYWFVKNSKDKGELLPEKYRTIFSNKQIVCVEYQELKDTDERDIFTRVQLGMALTVAEKLQAISTPRANLIRYLMDTFITPETLAHPDVAWDRSRARDFQIVGSVIYCLFKWDKHLGLKSWASTSTLQTWLSEEEAGKKKKNPTRNAEDEEGLSEKKGVPVDEEFRAMVIKTFETVVKLATTKSLNIPFRASKSIGPKVSPIEMVGAFILVHAAHSSPPKVSKKEVTLAGLGALFVLLRKRLREEHADVRSNGRVGRTMFEFCLDASKDPLGTLAEGEDAGLLEGEVEEGARWMQIKRPISVSAKKLKPRVKSEEPESSDEEVAQAPRWEEEEKTVPAKRRRTTARLSGLHTVSKTSPAVPKRRKTEPASRRSESEESGSDYAPRRAPTRKPVQTSHVSLPTPTPSSSRRTQRLLSEEHSRESSPQHGPDRERQSNTFMHPSPETSPEFVIPSPLPGSASPINTSQTNKDEIPDIPHSPTEPSTIPVISPSVPIPSAENLLAAMGVSVAPGMIPLMLAQMRLLTQGGSHMMPQLPFAPSSQATLSEANKKGAVKNEVAGAGEPAPDNLFAVNLAQGIQGSNSRIEDSD